MHLKIWRCTAAATTTTFIKIGSVVFCGQWCVSSSKFIIMADTNFKAHNHEVCLEGDCCSWCTLLCQGYI